MILVIAEKPDLGKAIAAAIAGKSEFDPKERVITKSFHGEPVTICWCFGHMLTLVEPTYYDERFKAWKIEDLPIYFENWDRAIIENGSTKARVAQIGKLLKSADKVIHAGDVDDEGQLLIDELLEWHKYHGPVLRLNTNDTSEAALAKALNNMKDNTGFVQNGVAAYGRQICDKTFGVNLSRYYSVLNGTNLPVGRVKMPTLGLVVQRDKTIEEHKKSFYYTLNCAVALCGETIPATYIPNRDDPHLTDGKILDKAYLQGIGNKLNGCQLREISIKRKAPIYEAPPLPFNQTKLYSYCEAKFGLSPKDVSEITQTLRDKYKAITYNRSDCQYLGMATYDEAPETLPVICDNLGLSAREAGTFDTSIKSRCFNDANITAHTAIIPTQSKQDLSKFTDGERKVYEAIAKYYLAQFLPPCEKEITKLTSPVPFDFGGTIESSYTRITKPGYKLFLSEAELKEESESEPDPKLEGKKALSKLKEGVYPGRVSSVDTEEKETRPPSRYTRSSLIEDMSSIAKYCENEAVKKLLLQKDAGKKGENGSIGTPATRQIIIEELVKCGYLRVEKKGKKEYLISTQLGREFYDILPDSIRKVDVSAKWWYEQEQIRDGKMTPDQMARDVLKTIRKILESGEGTMKNAKSYASGAVSTEPVGQCPRCGGDVVESAKGFRCTNKECDFIIFKDNKFFEAIGKKLTASVAASLLSKKQASLKGCKSKSGKTYDATILCDFSDKYPKFSFAPFESKRSGESGQTKYYKKRK